MPTYLFIGNGSAEGRSCLLPGGMPQKILVLLAAFAAGSFCGAPALAEDFLGAQTAPRGRYSLGLEADFINDRNLTHVRKPSSAEDLRGAELNGTRVLLKPSCELSEFFGIYVPLGIVRNDINARGYAGGIQQSTYSLSVDADFTSGAGVKANIPLSGEWFFGAGGQFLYARDKAAVTKRTANTAAEISYDKAVFSEWQVSGYAGKKCELFNCHLGIKFTDTILELTQAPAPHPDISFKPERKHGIIAGVEIRQGQWVSSFQAFFADGISLSIGTEYAF